MVRTVVKENLCGCQLSFDHCTIPAETWMVVSSLLAMEVMAECLIFFLLANFSLGNTFLELWCSLHPFAMFDTDPQSREEFQENSSIMLSQGRQVVGEFKAQISIANSGVSLMWHKQHNKKRRILISLFTLFAWCRLNYKNKMTTLHLVRCQHVVELFMLQDLEYYFFMAANCSLWQICRHDRWVLGINMHRRHALCDSCTAHNSTRCQVEHLPILLYCKIKSPFYKYHNLWIFLKICTQAEQTGKLSYVIELICLLLLFFFFLHLN